MTRAERSARNKRAHAIRRMLTDQDARQAKADGLALAWREVADTYAAMSTDDVLSTFGDVLDTPDPEVVAPVKPKRQAPAHIVAAQVEYHLAREVWQTGLAEALAGGKTRAQGGRPARGGETYPDEERDYRATHPAPMWKDFLRGMRAPESATA